MELRDYQKRLVQEIKDNRKMLLAVDMGLGKTISCLIAIKDLNLKKVLIVAPKTVAQVTWPDEIAKWPQTKDMTYIVIKGEPKERLIALKEDVQLYITNREQIVWLYKNSKIKFDMIIWDESSSLKGGKFTTKTGNMSRFGALCQLTEITDRVLLLTGTPSSNGLEDIWGQIKSLQPSSDLLEESKYKFLIKYFINTSFKKDEYEVWEPKDGSLEKVMKLCEPLIIKMKSEDYLTLPDFIKITTKVELDKKDIKTYKELVKEKINAEETIKAANPGVLFGKLAQLASGCVYNEDGTYTIYHEKKIEALKDLLEENKDSNILLFYNFKHEKDQLVKHFKELEILTTNSQIVKWNAGKIKILACHPLSAGHGLNLQHGGDVIVWLSLSCSLELYQQGNKRLHRSGQKNNVKCYHVICKNTVDEHILNAKLANKELTQQEIFKLIRGLT